MIHLIQGLFKFLILSRRCLTPNAILSDEQRCKEYSAVRGDGLEGIQVYAITGDHKAASDRFYTLCQPSHRGRNRKLVECHTALTKTYSLKYPLLRGNVS
jgi:hypothetical protein